MVPVARRNLFAEKGRFAISVAGVALAVLLILTVLALYRGWSRAGEVFEQLPGELWAVQQGTSDPFHSVSLIEPPDIERVSGIDGVQAVVPVLSRQMNFAPGGDEQSVRLMALDFGGFPASPDIQERFLPPQGQVVIDETLSRKTGLDEGDSLNISGVELTVAHVGPRGGDVLSQFAFVNFEDARAIFGVAGIVNYGMVVLDEGAQAGAVEAAIVDGHPDLQVYTGKEFAESVRKEIDESFIPVIAILVAIGFVVGAAVVGLTIYTATIERTREFGVMKAVGGSPGFLYRIVLSQSVMLTSAGFVVGVGGALLVARLAARAVPEFATDFQARDLGAVLAATLAMAVLASFVPVRRINSIDPAIVFRA
ncbi:MAG: ABC transporter permease [Dehalococcoidia bacterium]|nr:ABC transporter permease [Dehalococcoidia bacterium]